jgi:hypothetical protein
VLGGALLAGCSLPDRAGVAPTGSGSGLRILIARCTNYRINSFGLKRLGHVGQTATARDRRLLSIVSHRGVRIDSADPPP